MVDTLVRMGIGWQCIVLWVACGVRWRGQVCSVGKGWLVARGRRVIGTESTGVAWRGGGCEKAWWLWRLVHSAGEVLFIIMIHPFLL